MSNFGPAKTMPTPKGLMPSCLARMGRKGVTGAAAEKRRKITIKNYMRVIQTEEKPEKDETKPERDEHAEA